MDKKASDKKVIQVNLKVNVLNLKVICSIREIESRGLNEVGGKGSLDVKKMIVNSILWAKSRKVFNFDNENTLIRQWYPVQF